MSSPADEPLRRTSERSSGANAIERETGEEEEGQPPRKSFLAESKEAICLPLFLSVLGVASWALAGTAARVALHAAFLSIPFFSTYEFFGPNCLGCFAMGLATQTLPPEKEIPIVHRALCVGFCGSFTTFSSWVLDLTNQRSASGAFQELLSGTTLPFVFFLWGSDMGLSFSWIVAALHKRCGGAAAREPLSSGGQRKRKRSYRAVEYGFLALSCAAAVAVPVGVQVRINQGRISSVSSADIEAVALGSAGAVVRLMLSVFLNKRVQWRGGFPVGTLAANALGTFLAAFMDNYAHRRPGNRWFWVVANGVCGALSTVSSFVGEVVGFYRSRRRRMAYAYGFLSLAITVLIGAVGRRDNYA